MTAYKALATAEEVAVGKDLVRARALLTTLTNDIAPLARKNSPLRLPTMLPSRRKPIRPSPSPN